MGTLALGGVTVSVTVAGCAEGVIAVGTALAAGSLSLVTATEGVVVWFALAEVASVEELLKNSQPLIVNMIAEMASKFLIIIFKILLFILEIRHL